jgi:hypothetical protein
MLIFDKKRRIHRKKASTRNKNVVGKISSCSSSFLIRFCTLSLPRPHSFSSFSSRFLTLFFDSCDTHVWLYWTARSLLTSWRALADVLTRARYRSGEPSLVFCRALANLLKSNKSFSICEGEFLRNWTRALAKLNTLKGWAVIWRQWGLSINTKRPTSTAESECRSW